MNLELRRETFEPEAFASTSRLYPESATPSVKRMKLPDGHETLEIPHAADTSYLAHGYFRYIGKYPPQIVSLILNTYNPAGPILDPMCGGGTTLVEATLRGIDAIGCDVNPVSRIISSAVSRPVNPQRFASACQQLIGKLSESVQGGPSLFQRTKKPRQSSPTPKMAFCSEYFDESTKTDISTYLALLEELPLEFKEYFLMSLFAVLRKVSRANIKKMNLEIDDNKSSVVPFLDAIGAQLNHVSNQNAKYSEWARPADVQVIDRNALDTKLENNRFGAVFLHPPYLTNTAFSEFTQLQLAVMGIDHRLVWKQELRCRGSFLHESNGLKKYLIGWKNIMAEACRTLRPGGILVTVVGDGQMDYVRIPVGAITLEFAKDLDLSSIDQFQHTLNNNTGRTQSRKMTGQHVAIFRK